MIEQLIEKLFDPISDKEHKARKKGGADIGDFLEGQRVILPANKEEDWPEEQGVIVEYEGDEMYIVEVDRKYLMDDEDDGIREVHADAIVAANKKQKK